MKILKGLTKAPEKTKATTYPLGLLWPTKTPKPPKEGKKK